MAERYINIPFDYKEVKSVRAGDEVFFSGRIITARDQAHHWLLENDFKPLHNAVLYHCGPMYKEEKKGIEIIAAGPTTSARFNQYTPDLIEKYSVKAIIGKGGMDKGVSDALRNRGIYCAAIGGAAVYYAHCITKVYKVYKKEFGMTDAIWELEVKNFPVVCMIDSQGKSLYDQVEKASLKKLKTL
ncbi:MAG: FumA C-terminus/TtdB family hydratase beta subunit [bacterium]|nr:FumA C-terminus/TtdB family hydratase beta subunit [bacterium]